MATHVELTHLTKKYANAETAAVHDLTLNIAPGQITALLGPSGCGKTTTLKMIAGLIAPTSGDILFDGVSVKEQAAELRSAVMVFQNHLLFPHMSVWENVAFGLRMQHVNKQVRRQKAEEMLDWVQLGGYGARRPHQLSGGQQQRVALARALVIEPRLLLLDEPLSNLDAHLRDEMRDLIRTIQQEIGVTTVFVTHDQEEAVILADQIALLFDGKLTQFGEPRHFYERPYTEQVARFFGGVNFIPGRYHDRTQFETEIGQFMIEIETEVETEGILTIRPENVRFVEYSGENSVEAIVETVLYVGTYTRVTLRVGEVILQSHAPARLAIQPQDHVWIQFPADAIHIIT